jgi:hypothetical protein
MGMQSRVPMTAHSGDVRSRSVELSGWATFACVMLGINGGLDIVYGIAAIGNAHFYVNDAKYILSDLNAWGWILLATGALQIGAVASIMGGTSWGRWVGVAIAGLNAIGQLLFIPSAPYLSLALFTVDILIIYGLVVHGAPLRRT